jgi:hypothetical protein
MALAMFQISGASLGGAAREKLVRGRTKNWMERARDLGTELHKNCSQARSAAGAGFRIRENQIIWDDAAIRAIRESSGQVI